MMGNAAVVVNCNTVDCIQLFVNEYSVCIAVQVFRGFGAKLEVYGGSVPTSNNPFIFASMQG